jgi:redox-sensitive bicupin YhaK (pirin superfamily)
LSGERTGWVQLARGRLVVNGRALTAGDGASIVEERNVTLAGEGAELLFFDLAQ